MHSDGNRDAHSPLELEEVSRPCTSAHQKVKDSARVRLLGHLASHFYAALFLSDSCPRQPLKTKVPADEKGFPGADLLCQLAHAAGTIIVEGIDTEDGQEATQIFLNVDTKIATCVGPSVHELVKKSRVKILELMHFEVWGTVLAQIEEKIEEGTTHLVRAWICFHDLDVACH